MAKRYIKIGFDSNIAGSSDYVIDQGTAVKLGKGFFLPAAFDELPQSAFEPIATAAGGTLIKDGGTGFDIESPNPCPESRDLSVRKLRYIFSDYSTVSVPIGDRANILTKAQSIAGLWEAAGAGLTVICVDLLGEEIANANDFFGLTPNLTAFVPTGGNGNFYSGKIIYNSDTGRQEIIAVKTISEGGSAPPPIFTDDWVTCVGNFLDPRYGCGSGTDLEHRRLVVNYRTSVTVDGNSEFPPEERQLPIFDNTAALLNTCGSNIAGKEGVFCLGYVGESNRGIHRQFV